MNTLNKLAKRYEEISNKLIKFSKLDNEDKCEYWGCELVGVTEDILEFELDDIKIAARKHPLLNELL